MFSRSILLATLLFSANSYAISCDAYADKLQKEVVEKESLIIRGQVQLPPPFIGFLFSNKLKTRVVVVVFSPVPLTQLGESAPKTMKQHGSCTTPDGNTAYIFIDRPPVKATEVQNDLRT
jgi:hypothetical protein